MFVQRFQIGLLALGILGSSCTRRASLVPTTAPDYQGEVTTRGFRDGAPGPIGGPSGLYRILVERRPPSDVGPRQANVTIDSLTRSVSAGKAASRGESLASPGTKFVRVWFRQKPTATSVEMRGIGATIVVDSVLPRAN